MIGLSLIKKNEKVVKTLSTKACAATEKYGTANNQNIMNKRTILYEIDSTLIPDSAHCA